MKKKRNISRGVYVTLIIFSALSIFAIGGLAINNLLFPNDEFYKNTKINGVDVGGMNINDASNVVQANFVTGVNDISVTIKYDENAEWNFTSKDFEVIEDFSNIVSGVFDNVTSSNIFDRYIKMKELKQNDGNINISYRNMLGGFNEKLDTIINEINQELKEPEVKFDPLGKQIFTYIPGQSQITVERTKLENLIDNAFETSKKIVVYVPYEEIKPTTTIDELKEKTKLRSTFSTSYASSTNNRKSNVKTALNAFNGQIIAPEQEVSFNQTTGARTKENGYKPAKIILNGIYIEGSGGGVCQASTTLYNALLLAGLEILEVSKHSLPATYVPLALDAMVSEGIADLKFKNNTNEPIYIRTYGDDKKVYVEIYGLALENGEYYKTRSEFVKSIPHPGDRIVSDSSGEYSNKVTFKGEYLRLKYPQEGYEANAYLQRFSADGVLLEEKLIRHETYAAQEGIIIEGTEEIYEGITLPDNDVKFIPPQSKTTTTGDNVNKKIYGTNGEKYNP
ncbi:MAG: hypothetical protein E7376_01865 [Clostridiales bacterium]|nr:hypothetical protein [Clostridiales bacterium]